MLACVCCPPFNKIKKVLVLVPPPLYLIRFAPRPADWNKLRKAVCIVPGLVANEYMYIPPLLPPLLPALYTHCPSLCQMVDKNRGGRNSFHVDAVREPHE